MPGTIASPSGEIIACANTGNKEVYNCSNCKETIPLPPNQKIQIVCQQIQDHLEQCMPTTILHTSFKSNLPTIPTTNRVPPVNELCMPLQPRRTWSAEDERRRRLEDDPDAYDVGPHTVTCAGCHRPIRLNATGRYYAANWNKHKMGCKNTNTLNGAGAMSPESKFTGRVAAFRVAKPTESVEPFMQGSTSSVPAMHRPQQPPYQASSPSYMPQAGSYTNTTPWGPLESRRDQFAPKGLPEVNSHTSHRPSTASLGLHYRDHTTSSDYVHYKRAESEGSQPSANGGDEFSPHMGTRTLSRSPNAPSPRPKEEREAYGHGYLPYGVKRERYDQDGHMGSNTGLHRAREDPIRPLRHSIDHSRDGAYLSAPAALPEIRRPLDKGKARYTEPSVPSPPHSTRILHLQKNTDSDPITQRNDPHRQAQRYDCHTSLDPYEGQQAVSHREPRAKLSESRIMEENAAFSDHSSHSAVSSPELSTSRPSRPPSSGNASLFDPRPSARGRFDDRTLPPLNSLTLAHASSTDPSLSSIVGMTRRQRPQSNERHLNTSLTHDIERSFNWRERTRRWVRTEAALSASELDEPESVVLPPIRTESHCVSPTGMKRRLSEDVEQDGESTDAHRPSPPKVFVLPKHQNPSNPSTLRADNLSLRYKHSKISSVEAIDVGGDSKGEAVVGTSSERPVVDAAANTARLHPVWKWEQKEETASTLPNHILSHAEGDDDIVMSEQDAI